LERVRFPGAVIAAIAVITVLNLLWWEWLHPNARMRILSTAAAQVLYFVALQQLLRHPPRLEMAAIYRALHWIVVVYSALFAWSYASIGELLPTTARADAGYHRSVFSLASMLFQLALAVTCLALQFSLLSSRHAEAARQDWLTGLLNRRGFFEATRSAEAGSLIMLDVDHFKTINDHHGHAAGDRVLRSLAEVLKSQAEPPRQAARIGGEEFCLWLPGQFLEEAEAVAESLRDTCAKLAVTIERENIHFTLSGGITERLADEPLDARARPCRRRPVRGQARRPQSRGARLAAECGLAAWACRHLCDSDRPLHHAGGRNQADAASVAAKTTA